MLGADRGQVAGTWRGYGGKGVDGMVRRGNRVEEVLRRRSSRKEVTGRQWWTENG